MYIVYAWYYKGQPTHVHVHVLHAKVIAFLRVAEFH